MTTEATEQSEPTEPTPPTEAVAPAVGAASPPRDADPGGADRGDDDRGDRFDRGDREDRFDRGGRDRGRRGGGGGSGGRRRPCEFCPPGTSVVDYKDVSMLRRYISDRGKIEGRRRVGCTAQCQRLLAQAVKRARHMALLPYTAEHVRVSGVQAGRPSRR